MPPKLIAVSCLMLCVISLGESPCTVSAAEEDQRHLSTSEFSRLPIAVKRQTLRSALNKWQVATQNIAVKSTSELLLVRDQTGVIDEARKQRLRYECELFRKYDSHSHRLFFVDLPSSNPTLKTGHSIRVHWNAESGIARELRFGGSTGRILAEIGNTSGRTTQTHRYAYWFDGLSIPETPADSPLGNLARNIDRVEFSKSNDNRQVVRIVLNQDYPLQRRRTLSVIDLYPGKDLFPVRIHVRVE